MRTRTLTNLLADVRKACDVENQTTTYPDADLTEYINQGWTRIYGELTSNGENYYLVSTPFQFTTVSGQDAYYTTAATGVPVGTALLPTDMWRIKGVDVQIQSGWWSNADRWQFEQRNDYQPSQWTWPARPLYDYQGSGALAALRFIPQPSSAVLARIWYYPAAVRLAAGSDVIDGGNGWEMYAIWWAAREVATKDENYELCQVLSGKMAEMEQAIKREAASRNAGQAPKVRRVRYKRGMQPPGGWGR